MKVLWVTRAAAFVGGAERHVADAADALSARGVHSSLMFDPNAPADAEMTRHFDGAFPWVELQRQVAALRPDVLYVHQVDGRAALHALADTGVPVVRFFHDHAPFCLREHKYTTVGHHTCTRPLGAHCWPCLGPLNRAPGFPPLRLRTLSQARADLAANRRFAAFATGSVYMKDHVVAHGFSPASVRVLPMLVAPPDPRVAGPRTPGLLLFVGALVRGKGLDLLLAALPGLPEGVRLRVVGTGRQEGWFREQAARLGVTGRVDFLGRLPRDDLDLHYREASCVVVPSREPETFGLVGPEAFRHSTPVVAARVGGTGEWLLEGRTGLGFPSGDVGALGEAVRRTLDDPASAGARAQAGRDLVATRFTAARHADALLDLLGTAVGGRNA